MNEGNRDQSLRARKKHASRRAIEDAAWTLFAERGYASTSVNDIAERADVAPRTFFRYFPSKEAVLYGEFDGALGRVRAAFAGRPSDEPILTSVVMSLDSMADHFEAMAPERRRVLESIKRGDDAFGSEFLRERLGALVTELVHDRLVGDPDAALQARLVSGIVGLVMETAREHWLEQGGTEPLPEEGRRCLSVLTDLVAAARPDARPSVRAPARH